METTKVEAKSSNYHYTVEEGWPSIDVGIVISYHSVHGAICKIV